MTQDGSYQRCTELFREGPFDDLQASGGFRQSWGGSSSALGLVYCLYRTGKSEEPSLQISNRILVLNNDIKRLRNGFVLTSYTAKLSHS